jgi:uncharacterized delta-60 repeat protein
MKNLQQITVGVLLLSGLTFQCHAVLRGGDIDPGFNPGSPAYGTISSIAVQPDGKVLIGGNFDAGTGSARNGIARLNADGSLDTTFQNGMDGLGCCGNYVSSIALQSDGKVLIGGYFANVNGTNRTSIARLNADGSLDTSFEDGLEGAIYLYCYNVVYCDPYIGSVNCMAVQSDGKIFVGGYFNKFNGYFHTSIVRLKTDGSVDTSFQELWTGAGIPSVAALAPQTDGKVVIGGSFGIARLNVNGRVDTNFVSAVDRDVYAVALQPNGKVLIGGQFTTGSHPYFARLNTNGTLDTNFLARVDNLVSAIALQLNGKVLIGGQFTSVNGAARTNLARLNPDGSLDTTFQNGMAGTDKRVSAVALQDDGKVLIGGNFLTVNGASFPYVARLYGTAPLLLSNEGVVTNTYRFDVTGESNQIVVVEASTNFVNWITLATNTLAAGPLSFIDSGWRNYPNRFYRARSQ